jgi:RND family efflux transporter MFP subunit
MEAPHQETFIRQQRSDLQTPDPAELSSDRGSELKAIPRPEAKESRIDELQDPAPDKPASVTREVGARLSKSILQRLATLAIALVAVLVSIIAWDQYVTSPWTRDGRIRVQVASVAPQISGQITHLRIVDDQFVRKGDVLYQIEPFDFDVTLRTSRASLEQKQADLYVKKLQSDRRRRLSDLATTPEQQQIFEGNAIQAKAAVDAAEQQVAQAETNLKRTEVRSPVNGYVTNLLLREGDYARQGVSNVSIVDADSFWIDGYFEETKLAQLCVGDRAEAKLMGYAMPIIGHVTTVTRGISVSNAVPGAQGLPNVDPVYTWVRLAQRVPVRIAIDEVPPGVPLVSGTTATIAIRASHADNRAWFERAISAVTTSLSNVANGVLSRPGCIPVRA